MLLSNKAKGYILGAIAAATYGMNPLFALPLYADGMDADSVLFFRYMMAIPVMGLLLRIRGPGRAWCGSGPFLAAAFSFV